MLMKINEVILMLQAFIGPATRLLGKFIEDADLRTNWLTR